MGVMYPMTRTKLDPLISVLNIILQIMVVTVF